MKAEVEGVLHMVGGSGENSYATNSRIQEHAIRAAKPTMVASLSEVYADLLPEHLSVADLGCSSGPTTFMVITDVVDTISGLSRSCSCGRSPEILFFLNDLPGNDFNTIFRSLPLFEKKLEKGKGKFLPYYVVGAPGSFYGRLFPRESIHFMHSSYSLHWLSQAPRGQANYDGAPVNTGNIYISKTSPISVYKAYLEQFNHDFSNFLRMRAQELVSGGQMVLTLLGRSHADPLRGEMSVLLDLLNDALNSVVSEGLVEKEKADEFNVPFYAPSTDEVKSVVSNEGSFDLTAVKIFQLNWDPDDPYESFVPDSKRSGENSSRCVRAALEPMIVSQLGEGILEALFSRYAENVARHLVKEKTKLVNFTMVLKKIKKKSGP